MKKQKIPNPRVGGNEKALCYIGRKYIFIYIFLGAGWWGKIVGIKKEKKLCSAGNTVTNKKKVHQIRGILFSIMIYHGIFLYKRWEILYMCIYVCVCVLLLFSENKTFYFIFFMMFSHKLNDHNISQPAAKILEKNKGRGNSLVSLC